MFQKHGSLGVTSGSTSEASSIYPRGRSGGGGVSAGGLETG